MKKLLITLYAIISPLSFSVAQTPYNAPAAANPFIPGYFADPTIRKFGDTYYLYATTDGTGNGYGPAQVWVSKDFVNWKNIVMNWPTTEVVWAPDVVQQPDGTFRYYYCEPCNINIGERIPIITDTQYNSVGNPISTYAYQDIGVILTVTPRISPDGTVKMDVNPEVSQLTSNEIKISSDVSIPIIAQRTANTTVSVQSGESVLIGGLISTVDDSRTKKVPWIGNIPVIGALFRSKKFESDRKELLIVLTPQVVMPSKLNTTNIVDIMDMTKEGFKDSILESDLNRDPLQQKVLEKILPEQDADPNAVEDETKEKKKSNRTIKRENYTKELLIDP